MSKKPPTAKPADVEPVARADVRQTEVVPLGELRPHPRNYKKHPPDQLRHIVESLRQHGWYRNVVVARDGTILAGHGVVEAARLAGLATAPVFRLPVDPFSPAALKILAGDNELGKFAETDDRALTELLREIKETDLDGLLGTGFDEQMLASLVMVTRPESEVGSYDAAAEWVGMPAYEPAPNVAADYRLLVSFATEEERKKFVDANGMVIHKHLKGKGAVLTTYWPPRPKDDVAALRFEEEGADDEVEGSAP